MKFRARIVGRKKNPTYACVALDHAQLHREDYSCRTFKLFGTVGCRLENCRFEKTGIEDAAFGAGREISEFIECVFDGARITGGGGFSRFVRCSFRDVELSNWLCFKTEFINCVFSGRMRKCIFNGRVPERDRAWVGRERNDFYGNDFSAVDLADVTFRTGVDLNKQRLPSGPEYLYLADAAMALERASSGIMAWQHGEERRSALAIVNGLWDDVREGQQQLLLRADDYYAYSTFLSRDAIDRVFTLLRGDPT